MARPSRLTFGLVALGSAALVLAAIALVYHQRAVPSTTARFTLTSASVDLPADDAQYPAGPHANAVNLHCTACHSASMVLTQPPLSPEQWKAEVTKMREAYKAPVPQDAVPDILAYLSAMSARSAASGPPVEKSH